MSPWTLQEFSLIPGGAIFLCLVFPQLASGTPPALQSLHQGQTLRPCWDGAAFLLFIFTFLGFSLSFPWVWATQMHFRGAAGMWCRQHCPVLWLCVFQPFWTLRMAAGSPDPSGSGLHAGDCPFLEKDAWLAGAPRRTPELCAHPSLSPQESLTFHPHCLPQDWLQGQ